VARQTGAAIIGSETIDDCPDAPDVNSNARPTDPIPTIIFSERYIFLSFFSPPFVSGLVPIPTSSRSRAGGGHSGKSQRLSRSDRQSAVNRPNSSVARFERTILRWLINNRQGLSRICTTTLCSRRSALSLPHSCVVRVNSWIGAALAFPSYGRNATTHSQPAQP
jgi:hypothetical protein